MHVSSEARMLAACLAAAVLAQAVGLQRAAAGEPPAVTGASRAPAEASAEPASSPGEPAAAAGAAAAPAPASPERSAAAPPAAHAAAPGRAPAGAEPPRATPGLEAARAAGAAKARRPPPAVLVVPLGFAVLLPLTFPVAPPRERAARAGGSDAGASASPPEKEPTP